MRLTRHRSPHQPRRQPAWRLASQQQQRGPPLEWPSVRDRSAGPQASGRELNREALTADHRTLPLGTKVKVTNKSNGHSVVVTINDRGPFVRGRIIDVTPAAARTVSHVMVGGSGRV